MNSCSVFAFFVPLTFQVSHLGLQQILLTVTSRLKNPGANTFYC